MRRTDPEDKSPPSLAEIRQESTAYLVEECGMVDEFPRALKWHYREIFENELAGW